MKYEQSASSGLTTLEKNLQLLEGRIEWVPFGWVAIYQEMIVRLSSLDRRAHGDAEVHGPWIDDVEMRFTAYQADAAVTGILSKATRRSHCTCKVCGGAGRVRNCAGDQTVLCARCYAPRELSEQLGSWLQRLYSPRFSELGEVFCVNDFEPALLTVIPEVKWRWLPDRLRDDAIPFLLSEDLLTMIEDFECLLEHINSEVLVNE
ncbi:MAG: hypothetical protein Q7K57_57330 [Burkholderiaceae bacterium]|nr:hypothetical protein [Burkholderiaceae bacterium]